MLALGMFASLARCTASRNAEFIAGSGLDPLLAATVISRASLVKSWPRFASSAPFLCLIEDHLE